MLNKKQKEHMQNVKSSLYQNGKDVSNSKFVYFQSSIIVKMKYSGISFIGVFIGISCLIGSIESQCCLKFNGAECVLCPENMHVYRGNCIYNLPFCNSYSNGFDCSECNDGYILEDSACILIPKDEQKPEPKPEPKPQAKSQNPNSQSSKPQPSKSQPPKSQAKPQQNKPQTNPQTKDYKEFLIGLPLDTSGTNERSQRALLVDQILRSTYPDIRKADIVKATDRLYPDNSKVVELIYRVNGPEKSEILYQGLMVGDLDTFIFEEVSFKKVEEKRVSVESEKSNNNAASFSSANGQGNVEKESTSEQVNNPPQANTQQDNNPQNQESNQQQSTSNQQQFTSNQQVSGSIEQQSSVQKMTQNSVPNKQPPDQLPVNATSPAVQVNAEKISQTDVKPTSTNPIVQQSPGQKHQLPNENTASSSVSSTPEYQPSSLSNLIPPTNPQPTVSLSQSLQPSSQPQTTSMVTVSGSPQDEYSTIKFEKLSDMDALVDINFVLALNQINNKLPQLQGLVPTQILVELGYNTSKLSIVHYIITFEAQDENKVVLVQEVKLKVVTASSLVEIDSVVKKEPKKESATHNSTPNTDKSPDSGIESLAGDKLSQKSSYTEVSSNPAQADIFFLIFLDNLGKGLEKKLAQNGKNPGYNEIVYAGRFDSKEVINFWVETRVTCANGAKSLFKVTGTQKKMTYEVKINDIVPIEEKNVLANNNQQKKEVENGKVQEKVQNVENKNTSHKPVALTEVIKKFQQAKEYISGLTVSPVTTSTTVVPSNPAIFVGPSPVSTNTEPKPMNQPSNQATVVTSVQQQPPKTQVNEVQISQVPQVPQYTNPNPSAVFNVPVPSKHVVFPVSPFQPQLTPQKPQQPFSSKTFSEINQTINQKAGGFDEIDPRTVQKDDGVLRSIETLLAGRPNRENMKLYKAYIKNFGIKAEYKIYLMDLVSRTPRIDVAEGYVTYDVMKKRIFVISYGSLSF